MRQPMTVPKITHFSRGSVKFDLTGVDRKSIKSLLHVCGYDDDSDEWLKMVTGEETKAVQLASEKYHERGGGFEKVTLETDYIVPYMNRLIEWTGFDFPDGAEVPITALNGIFHTHGVLSAAVTFKKNPYKSFQGSDEGPRLVRLTVQAYTHVYLNSNEKEINATQRAEKALYRCVQYVNDKLGKTAVPREFIETGNGLYKHNPDYASGKPMPIHKCCDNEAVWQELFGIWHKTAATAGQDAMLVRMARVWADKPELSEKWPTLRDYQGFHCDDYRTHVTIAQFKASEVPPVPAPAKAEK